MGVRKNCFRCPSQEKEDRRDKCDTSRLMAVTLNLRNIVDNLRTIGVSDVFGQPQAASRLVSMATSTNAKRFYSPKNGSCASNPNAISTLSKLIPSSRPASFQVSRRSFASTRSNDGKKAWIRWRFIEPRQGAVYDSTPSQIIMRL